MGLEEVEQKEHSVEGKYEASLKKKVQEEEVVVVLLLTFRASSLCS